MSSFFSSDKRTPYEKAKEQSRGISTQIRQEKRQLDRQINQADREILRLSTDIRKHAKDNNKEALRTLAKTVVKIKHNKSRLYGAKANLDNIDGIVKNQLTNVKITGIMQKSTEIARSMAQLMKVNEMQGITAQFSKELMKMGVMGEMMNETMDAAFDDADLEEETDEEVAKVLDEILAGKVGQLPSVVTSDAERNPGVAAATAADADSEEDDMERRLQALRS